MDINGTGLAISFDLGEWNDVHPMDKQNVSHRLALLAEHKIYKTKEDSGQIWTGPALKALLLKQDRWVYLLVTVLKA